ncbi:DUF3131 domain-containing protein [Ovoidimarina sediminis]|uniref:DUF3131 domain-containing protein n=1 Tax=Ovoidimarina sediminis TaxID=3079856 RepID=UPI0029158C57|nr:DUF3131 domain-containing protein [Rhodophyticola sp. MJ-SS7]MDU8945954.1 DUF3131 domain-containing protein [Rhodophyticola sp. MJ-SS7]
MDRRTFLSHAVLSGAVSVSPAWRSAEAASSFPAILLIEGVTLDTPAGGLFSFLDPIVSQNIPVGLTIRSDPAEWNKRQPNPELMGLLSTLTADYPGLIDLALEIPELASLRPYLRMRAASVARNRFKQAMVAAAGHDALHAVPETITAALPKGDTPVLRGVRSAGILTTILLPAKGASPDIWRNEDGTQQINGGWRLPTSPTAEDITQALSEATSRDSPVVFVARFPDDPALGTDALFNRGTVIGDGFRRNLSASRNYLILPSELRIRSGAVFSRNVVLCLQFDGSGAAPYPLAEKMTAASVPFTEITGASSVAGVASDTGSSTVAPEKCILVSGADGQTWEDARRHAFGGVLPKGDRKSINATKCAVSGVEVPTDTTNGRHAGFDVLITMSDGSARFSGFDAHGALRLNATLTLDGPQSDLTADRLLQRIEETAAPNEDVVLLIKQNDFRAAEEADSLTETLYRFGASDRFSLRSIDEYLEAVSVHSEPARLLRVAQRWPARQTARDIPAAERDRLLNDARVAWSYFEQLTDSDTGLVPATAWIEGDKLETYDFSTMWDTGSLILAIISAHSIGLLTDDTFSARIGAVLGGLATGVLNGLRLPKGLSSTTRRAAGDDKYNASDTGRLLVSLHLLQSYTQQDLGIRKILDGWDLIETIKDGVPLTASGSSLVSSYRSNYAGYIARAFALWGYPVRPPYTEPEPGSAFDRGVHVLQEVADFGPIGTEPHLLETVELGASGLAEAASEALFAAQIEEYLASGRLACVSEGPIAREPWFVYQGYQIEEDGGSWTAETLDPSPRFKTRGFLRAIDMLNSKAAFLWSVCRPCDYSDLLLAEVRAKAMASSLGVSPGVFFVTGNADQAYSDVNTNGVILQAIAYRLNGSKPAAEWRFKD